MGSANQLIELFTAGDPIGGTQALHELLALGDSGEEALFSSPIEFPRTVQVRRRWLQYVASRENTVVGRLIARMRDQDQFKDAHSCSYLFAGIRESYEATRTLYEQISPDFTGGPDPAFKALDWGPASNRFASYGYAGGIAGSLWNLVKSDKRTWEKLATFAFRGACATVARKNEGDLWEIEELITHEWGDFELVRIAGLPDAAISNRAIQSSELWSQANDPFMTWRRGGVADEILRQWSQHDHWRVRDFGAKILASLGFKRTVTSVIDWLRREPAPSVRVSLLHALERSETVTGADELIEHFNSFQQEGRPFLAKAAWRSSEKNRAFTALKAIVLDDDPAAAEALVSLARLGYRPTQIDKMLDSHKYYCRLNAALAIAYLGERNAADRLVAMQREAATPFERIFLAAALAKLGKPNGTTDLNEELVVAAGSRDYEKRVDLFFVHRYLQTAVLDGLAAGDEQNNDLLNAWRAEFEPLDPEPKLVVPEISKATKERSKQSSLGMSPQRQEHSQPAGRVPESFSVFISYSHQDEKMRAKLGQHLTPLVDDGLIRIWHDREIEAGADWEREINTEIGAADIILLLVSASFLNSRYCRKELLRALEQRSEGKSLPIPIILRPCDWTSVFNQDAYTTQALPRDDRPVAGGGWPNQDAAFATIAKELRTKIERMRG